MLGSPGGGSGDPPESPSSLETDLVPTRTGCTTSADRNRVENTTPRSVGYGKATGKFELSMGNETDGTLGSMMGIGRPNSIGQKFCAHFL